MKREEVKVVFVEDEFRIRPMDEERIYNQELGMNVYLRALPFVCTLSAR